MIKPAPHFSLTLDRETASPLRPCGVRAMALGLAFIQGPPGVNGTNGKDGVNGKDGRDGVSPGSFPGFGQISYTQVPASPGIQVQPNATYPLTFAPDGSPQDSLNGVFQGFGFWDGTKINARAMYDLVEVQINLQIISQIAGGFIQASLDAGSPSGPIVSGTATLFSTANMVERVTFLLNFQTLSNVLANGIRVFLRGTVPFLIVRQTLLIIPRSTHG